mgnify:CR=1 FL=1
MQKNIEENQKIISPMNSSLQIQKILNESHDLHGFCEDLTQI